jgi:hypothetical protein
VSSAPTPLNPAPVPVRTKLAGPSDSGISWVWIKFFQGLYNALTSLSFANIAGLLNISQINASGTRNATTFLRGDATWSPLSGAGLVSGMTGDGVVYKAAVPVVAGNLVPVLQSYPANTFVASPAAVAGPLSARQLTAADFGTAFNKLQAAVSFTSAGGRQDTTASMGVAAPWVKATTVLVATVVGGTADHPGTDEDPAIENVIASIINIVPGSGFTVVAYALEGSEGQYLVNVIGVN